ncbi:hypothetical protein SETIT_9G238500v2 [Setaria italica]|uniref:Uncharacterized protein n=1 Tax=Setaria italica TaxID=4555 RepID=A0A368SJX7_SETIT|nr:hypothetical protein SETIT_9G238500v2 [Setaria italica]
MARGELIFPHNPHPRAISIPHPLPAPPAGPIRRRLCPPLAGPTHRPLHPLPRPPPAPSAAPSTACRPRPLPASSAACRSSPAPFPPTGSSILHRPPADHLPQEDRPRCRRSRRPSPQLAGPAAPAGPLRPSHAACLRTSRKKINQKNKGKEKKISG